MSLPGRPAADRLFLDNLKGTRRTTVFTGTS